MLIFTRNPGPGPTYIRAVLRVTVINVLDIAYINRTYFTAELN